MMPVQPDHTATLLDRLTKLHPKLIDLGLERTIQLSEACGAPHRHLPPVIHIAGTNGKGSVSAFLRSMAEAAGLSVHVYNSPHLCRFNERIRLNGHLISDAELVDVLSEIEKVNAGHPITFFESTTVAAFLAFARHPADLLILETGLGGLFDSTNIIDETACSVITPIAFDHEQFLGRDIATIARQKAGIMRTGKPSVWAAQDTLARAELRRCADQLGSEVYEQGTDFHITRTEAGGLILKTGGQQISTPPLSLHGAHQTQNAALALMALKASQLVPDLDKAAAGASTAIWPARVQRLPEGELTRRAGRPIWLDGAHNVHGAEALKASLSELDKRKWTVIFGALNTRPADEFLSVIKPVADRVHCVTIPDQPAALTADELASLAGKVGLKAATSPSLQAACTAIAEQGAKQGGDDDRPVVICGSLYLAGEVLRANNTLPD